MADLRLTENEVDQRLRRLKGWKRQGLTIRKTYEFSGFIAAMAFVNFVAGEAEAMDHHPNILIEYNTVALTLSTHSAKGVTEKDMALAQRLDA
ncbi:MAG TPA: 4a-hydroxytetrahydrobiopterin dehydratase [Elusimicrobiota bacterium]|nr:4a-hydroxytetrahydrobiopterin dehydratase [Elusimicrobiota bacterium]